MLFAFYLLPGGPTGTIMSLWLCPHLSLALGVEPQPALITYSPGLQGPVQLSLSLSSLGDIPFRQDYCEGDMGRSGQIGYWRLVWDQDEGDLSGNSWMVGDGKLSGFHSPSLDWASDSGLVAPIRSCFQDSWEYSKYAPNYSLYLSPPLSLYLSMSFLVCLSVCGSLLPGAQQFS